MRPIRLLTITLASTIVLFSALSLVSYLIKADQARNDYYREQDEERGGVTFYGPYCYPDRHPQFLLTVAAINFFMLAGLCFARTALLTVLLPIPSLAAFAYWFMSTQEMLAVNETKPELVTLDRYLYSASALDVGVLSLLLVILLLGCVQLMRRRREFESLP